MRTTIRSLKDHLSAYINTVKAGQELIITCHGVPIAKMVPITAPEAQSVPSVKQFIKDIEALHQTLKCNLKKSLSDTVIESRRDEEY